MTSSGNVFETVIYINDRLPELVDYVLSIEFHGGHYSTVLLRAPSELLDRLRKEKRI